MAYVKVNNQVALEPNRNRWQLCFQDCEYHLDNGDISNGFRFIWRRPDGSLQAARGQARIPSRRDLETLIQLATSAGWFL